TGEFALRVADPQMFSQPATIQVQAVSMKPPRVVTLAPLILEGRGSLVTITKSVLHVDDPDNPADVLVMVLEPPRHGRLTRLHGDRPLARFKLEGLSREEIQYVHDGSEGVEDGVVLQVNDGHSYRNILLQVRIVQKVLTDPCGLTAKTEKTGRVITMAAVIASGECFITRTQLSCSRRQPLRPNERSCCSLSCLQAKQDGQDDGKPKECLGFVSMAFG
ncbi:hypothetical protein CHARACLAT_026203, partial [Characodon lateralis]|nr:hypothetical protein [Characodon lateralis]